MTQNRVNDVNPFIQRVIATDKTVFSSSVLMPFDLTIPQITEGGAVISASITPKFSTSKLLIEYLAAGNLTTANSNYFCYALFQDSTANAIAAVGVRIQLPNIIRYIMTSGTTSSTTFQIRSGPGQSIAGSFAYTNANTTGTRLLGGSSTTYLMITEYLG